MKPELTPEQYAIERAICDKAAAYAESVMCDASGKRVRNYMTAAECTHPDYAACNNDMRGRVEQFELLRDLPARFVAYLGTPHAGQLGPHAMPVTTWTGNPLGTARRGWTSWRPPNSHCASMSQYYATIGGREYTGRSQGAGMCIALRETAASKRARAPKPAKPIAPIFINWAGPDGRETIDSVYVEDWGTYAAMKVEASRLISEYQLAGFRNLATSRKEVTP